MNPNNKPTVRKRQVIQKSLDSTFNPQRQLLQKQIAGVGASLEGDLAGLEAKKTRAFEDITEGANRRGLVFSGIPLHEQAEFVATDFLPAQARLKQGAQDKKFALQQAMFELGERQRLQAETIFQQEQDRLQAWLAQQQQLAAQRQAAQSTIEAARIQADAALKAAQADQPQQPAQGQTFSLDKTEAAKLRRQFTNLIRSGETGTIKAIQDNYLRQVKQGDPAAAARAALLERVIQTFRNPGIGVFAPK